MVIARLIIFYGIDEYLSAYTGFCGLNVYPVYTTGSPAETKLPTVLGVGEDEVLALLRITSDSVLIIVRDVRQSKDVENTLGVIPHSSITR